MERDPSFRTPEMHSNKNSYFERLFALSTREFERQTGIYADELRQFSYKDQPRMGLEAFKHREGQITTLIIPPPTPGTISIEDLATMAVPVIRFIEQEKPDIVIGCDRGARIYSVAVHSMWNRLNSREGKKFSTLDEKLYFARLSTSLSVDITSVALAAIIRESMKEAKRQSKGFNGKRPKIMFIDDWVLSGATRRHILQTLKELDVLGKVDLSFAVMCGPGGDVSGAKNRVNVPWQDNPDVIGINYTKEGRVFPVRTESALKIRKRLHKATGELAIRLK